MAFARTIIEETDFSTALDEGCKQFPRLNDLWEGWKWRLSRGPEIDSVPIPGSNPTAYLIKTPDLGDYELPSSVTFLYTFTPDEVTLIGIRIEQ